jgi:hypothetical protein
VVGDFGKGDDAERTLACSFFLTKPDCCGKGGEKEEDFCSSMGSLSSRGSSV